MTKCQQKFKATTTGFCFCAEWLQKQVWKLARLFRCSLCKAYL